MTYQSKNPIISEAIEKAWETAKNQREAAENYLQMLRSDKVLRDAATARYLQRIASEDVSARPRANRIPNVSVKEAIPVRDYSADIKGSGTNKTLTGISTAGIYPVPSYYGSAMKFDGEGDYFTIPANDH